MINGGLHLIGVGHIDVGGEEAAVGLGGHLLEMREAARVDVGGDDAVAVGEQAFHDGEADATSASGYERRSGIRHGKPPTLFAVGAHDSEAGDVVRAGWVGR